MCVSFIVSIQDLGFYFQSRFSIVSYFIYSSKSQNKIRINDIYLIIQPLIYTKWDNLELLRLPLVAHQQLYFHAEF